MRGKTDEFYTTMQAYIAVTTVSPSTLRNQGVAGVIQAAQDFLSTLDLNRFTVTEEKAFLTVLDTVTKELRRQLPRRAHPWGVARKALNLFVRGACYNRFLSPKYALAVLEPWMEIPLDSLVAKELKTDAKQQHEVLPPWPGLKGLKPPVSRAFQSAARQRADAEGITRPHLDMRIWTTRRPTNKTKEARP